MLIKKSWGLLGLFTVFTLLLAACGGGTSTPNANPTAAPTSEGTSFQIPDVQAGKFNVAMVLIGPHDDGGWSQAHYEGLQYIEKNVPNVHTAYIENVPEGADSEQVFRELDRKGFKMFYGTYFDFGDQIVTVAVVFCDI